jgi:hypothetical protein
MFFPLSRLEYCSDFSKVSEPNYIVTEKMLTNKREQTTLVDIESRCIKDSGRFGKKTSSRATALFGASSTQTILDYVTC